MFWPDADPDRARDSLVTALWSIRRCLRTARCDADKFLFATKSTVRWTADTVVDALQFVELARRAEPADSEEALQIYRGDFLEGDYDDWAVSERERIAALYETVLTRVVKTSRNTDVARQLIARNPYHEEAYSVLIEAELAAGRHSSAASWVERCRKALSEISEKPSSSFNARFDTISHIGPLVSEGVTLPFAGRENELGLIAAKFKETASGHGSITLVHGEAGIGKSALLGRAARMATENGLRIVVIHCSGEIPSMFGPWPSTFGALAAGDFDAFVETHGSDVVTAVAQAIAAQLRERTALIADDVHALTAEALDIFVALAQVTMSQHAVLAGSRPEGVLLLRSRLKDFPFDELPIGRLDRSNFKWALAQALGSDHPQVLDSLYERTSGHPLFFNGLLNSLVTSGVLTRVGYQWQLTKPIGADIELPDTLKRFIETRLHARGDAPRIVACALALELGATADDLAAVTGMDESRVLDALDDLLALGVIMQPPTGAPFAFTHDLVREVAALGLNVGRRTALHRSFAQRLQASTEREASLRLARHLQAAGESLSAAQAYLKSAHEALELNAAQDAIERCDAGIAVTETLQRTTTSNTMLARLHTTAARALMTGGNAEDAIRRAREAVALARACGDPHVTTQAILELAVMEGAVYQILEQQADAAEAAQSARLYGDDVLEAQALVQQASAARELGLRDEALRAAQTAQQISLKCGRADILQAALEELLRTQMTWWRFEDALEAARTSAVTARNAAPLAAAAFLQVRCALWYLLGRFDEAQSDLQTALLISSKAVVRRRGSFAAPTNPLPLLQFACHYMGGKIAAAQNNFDESMKAAEKAAQLINTAKLPRYREALSLLQIDMLLRRNLTGDNEAARGLASSLNESTLAQGLVGWSDCAELARARVAARLRAPGTATLLRRALNTVEENAHRAPLDTDWAFARLAEAAFEASEIAVAVPARERSEYYRSRRLAAASAALVVDSDKRFAVP
jgi:predicted ATPase